jgi:small-conductance mechanosensitive channel
MEHQLEQTFDPAEAVQLTVHLETVDIRKATAEYRHQLTLLGDDLLTQEQRNTQVKQDVERLTSLVEKYASGEGIAQRLLLAFERLRRERLRYSDAPVKALEARIQGLTAQMFAMDDRLYDFYQQAETRMVGLRAALQSLPAQPHAAEVAKVRQALDEQKAALREQQQVLAELIQDHTRLLVLQREYKHLLDDSYLYVLTKMFWLRDAKTLRWDMLYDTAAVAIQTAQRLRAFVQVAQVHIRATWVGAVSLWLLAPLVCLVLPWMLYRVWRRLRHVQGCALAAYAEQNVPPRLGSAMVVVMQAAVWPGYLALVAWLLGQGLTQLPEQRELARALVGGLQIGALVLGLSLLGHTLLRADGWGQRCWGLSPALCRLLRRLVVVTCLAALVFLVPRYILLTAPGEGETAVGSLTLARTLFLAFQGVIVLLVGILGRRGSPVVDTMLVRSHQRDGLLWRIWPFVHLLLLAGMLGLMGLDMLGYRYAARFIWLRALGSLSVVLTLRMLLFMLVLRLLRGLVGYVFSMGGRLQRRYPDIEAAAERYLGVLSVICQGLLVFLAGTIILELWGLSISWFLTTPLGWQILTRTLVVALSVGLTIGVIQVSNALTDYLLQPRTTTQGGMREPSRKLKTLAPLIQTVIKVGAVFAAVLVVLEQLGVSTGPILTGVGIFGLAIGFASQSLIKDVINGLFILFEDSLSVGDAVTLRGIGGQVEKVTLRAITIRDLYGSVHVIPNSSIDMITNMSREYSRYVLDIGVAYGEDVEEVMGILHDIDEAMRHDPTYGKDMLQPIEALGLERFAESAMIIRALLKTRPGQQGRIGREFNRRLKKVLDERGIEMPFPHRTLSWATPKDGVAASMPRSGGGQQLAARDEAP